MVRLGDKEGALALRGSNSPLPGLGLARRERRDDLLLVALDALRSRHDRDSALAMRAAYCAIVALEV